MNTYTICPAAPGGANWDRVPTLEVGCRLWTEPVDIRMSAQICYTPDALLVRQRAWEQDVRAEHRAAVSMVCEDSCMEFFFCLQPTDGRYFNFELNPNGCSYIGFGLGRNDSIRLLPNDEDELLDKQVLRHQDGWELRYQIPLSFLRIFYPGYTLAPGQTLRGNCFKCGDLTPRPHYFSWNPVTSETPDFHRPCDFGEMVLG